MTTATITLWVIAVGMAFIAWRRKDGSLEQGARQGWKAVKRNIAVLVLAFVIVGYVNVLSPQDLIQKYLGPDSGWEGLLLAEGIGMLLPGGPYVVFPLIAVIYQAGAGIGPVVTLISSWSALALLTVTFELPFMGWRFTLVRWGLGLVVPLFAGVVVMLLL